MPGTESMSVPSRSSRTRGEVTRRSCPGRRATGVAARRLTRMATTETAPGQQLPDQREVLDWELFGTAARELAQTVVDDGFVPDIVIAVARGGLPPGGAIAYALGTKAVGTLNVEFYTGIDERLPDPVVLPPLLDTTRCTGCARSSSTTSRTPARRWRWCRRSWRCTATEARTAVLYVQAAVHRRARLRVASHGPVDRRSRGRREPPVTAARGRNAVARCPAGAGYRWRAQASTRPSPVSLRKNGPRRTGLSRTGRVGPSQPSRSGRRPRPGGRQARWYRGGPGRSGSDRPRSRTERPQATTGDSATVAYPLHRLGRPARPCLAGPARPRARRPGVLGRRRHLPGVDRRSATAGENGSNEFVFYDGPPFANGLPHYGHLLTGYAKDVVPRYQTMRGHRVERRFGWDTHGLPAELEAQRLLGITETVADRGDGHRRVQRRRAASRCCSTRASGASTSPARRAGSTSTTTTRRSTPRSWSR